MILYHGSNVKVEEPQILPTKRFLDFGAGFYLTSDLKQAQKWAIRTSKNRGTGEAIISVYEFDKNKLNTLQFKIFNSADKDWLRYVTANRTGKYTGGNYDIVIGPVANDQAIRTINQYIRGYFSEDIAIQLLLPQRLKDQYVFKTNAALTVLKFMEGIIL